MRRFAIYAVLTNDQGVYRIPGHDWQMILMWNAAHIWGGPDNRWDANDGAWLWTEQEGRRLADVLEYEAPQACAGYVDIDTDYDNGVHATKGTRCDDGLTPEERTKYLIAFLRQGGFRYRLTCEEIPLQGSR